MSRTLTPKQSGKAPMHQVYVPKKVEVVAEPAPVAVPLPSIMIGSMTAPIIDANKPVVVGGQDPSGVRDQVMKKVAEAQDKSQKLVDPRYRQPKWCPTGLDKTQKRKLQRARPGWLLLLGE